MTNNLGNNVSRVLDTTNRNLENVVFQQKRPPLDSEWNLAQDIENEKFRNLVKSCIPSGFLDIGEITTAPENRGLLNSSWKNSLKFKNKAAVVNGWIVHVGGGTNQSQTGSQLSIWEDLSNDLDEIAYITKNGPLSGYRQDLIFLEVFQKLIGTGDTIYKYGSVQSAVPAFDNDLIDPNIEIETSRRVQIQYNIRYVQGVDFDSYRDGLGFSGCYAKGASPTEVSTYSFIKDALDPGLYIAGDGSTLAQNTLGTVDGYTYAIPILRIHKRNRTTWSLTNQNGSSYSLTSGSVSDRPDFLFYDEINSRDVEDLRHLVSFSNYDYTQLLEKNIDLLWTKKLPEELSRSTLDINVSGNKVIYVDGISTTPTSGIDISGRVPDARRRTFSEGRESQIISYYVDSPTIISGSQIVFTPIGYTVVGGYELFDETTFYVSSVVPTVQTYDITTNTITTVADGTWSGLGVCQTWNYLSGTRNKIIYTPNILDIQNKKVVFTFTLNHREGGGLDQQSKGFKYPIYNILSAKNLTDSFPIDFNKYSNAYQDVVLPSPRKVGVYTDSAISRSISSFETAAYSSIDTTKYKAASCELTYYLLSNGSLNITFPSTLYNRTVLGVLQVYNITKATYITPAQTKSTISSESFRLSGLIVEANDMLSFKILLGNYTVDYVPHIKGIRNIAKSYQLTSVLPAGSTSLVISLKEDASLLGTTYCDGALATTGFFNGTTYKHIAFANNSIIYLSSVVGLGSSLLKITLDPTLSPPETYDRAIILFVLGYYNPQSTDSFYFQYEYLPYAGVIQKRITSSETQTYTVVKPDENIVVTTAGTGKESQYLPIEYRGLTETLPINNVVYDFNLLGDNVSTPITGGYSSLRRIPGRSLASTTAGVVPLKEGQDITIGLGSSPTSVLRGAIINSPKIIERGIDFSTPFNHLTQWSAIVKGKDSFSGELFLMVITTVSAIYNATEGLTYEYLSLNGTYAAGALGLGSETILNNTLTGIDLTQNLGDKIYGAVDIFPLKNRPLELR